MPIIGYNYGARNRKRVYSALKRRHHHWRNYYGGQAQLAMWIVPEQLIAMFGGTQDTYGDRRPCVPNHQSLLYSCRSRHYLYHTCSRQSARVAAQSYYVILPVSLLLIIADCVGAFYGV